MIAQRVTAFLLSEHRWYASSVFSTFAKPLVTFTCGRHPWREWIGFLDHLRTKGYFSVSEWETQLYADINHLEEPCLSFARDRSDVIKSLSMPDLKKLVDKGCPNLERKVVNSSKRLRAFLRLNEADVCAACNLRGSCDKAYVVPMDSQADARTVDVLRLLLIQALDTLVKSDSRMENGGEDIATSSRKLLCELVELSNASPNPCVPRPINKSHRRDSGNLIAANEITLSDGEMKRGDWMCSLCNFMNFARNIRCLECNGEGPKSVIVDHSTKKGDWICIKCNAANFSRNRKCIMCKAAAPKRIDMHAIEFKRGDWRCRQCNFMNFVSDKVCLRCHENRPKKQLAPGEWECQSCDYLNFRRNKFCLKCRVKRPTKHAAVVKSECQRP